MILKFYPYGRYIKQSNFVPGKLGSRKDQWFITTNFDHYEKQPITDFFPDIADVLNQYKHTTYVFGKQNPNQNIYEWFFFQLIKTIENYVFVKRYKHHLFRPLTIYVCIDKYKV